MKKKYFILITCLLVIGIKTIFTYASDLKINIDIKEDSLKYNDARPDFSNINIVVAPVTDYKKFEISPIFASRPGIEFNITTDKTSSLITFSKEDGTVVRKMSNYGISYISFKYLPGKDDIPRLTTNKDITNIPEIEKTRNSFGLGLKKKNSYTKTDEKNGPSLCMDLGFILDDRVHQYENTNLGHKDTDVHFYFEVEPGFETEYFSAGINYNTYFHQFGFKLGLKF